MGSLFKILSRKKKDRWNIWDCGNSLCNIANNFTISRIYISHKRDASPPVIKVNENHITSHSSGFAEVGHFPIYTQTTEFNFMTKYKNEQK